MKRKQRTVSVLATSLFGLVLMLGVSGCDGPKILDGVRFNVEPNLETAKVQLDFSKDIQTDLGGTFDVNVKGVDYGQIEVEPSTASSPFNVGFRLNLEIVNDQNLVQYTPVTDLPSGQPIPIPNLNRAFAKVQMKNELNKNFDVYAYVDIAGKDWLGVAVVLNFINNKIFPAGISVSQGFVKGKDGNNDVYGAFFGPKVDNSGNMLVPGGIAVFANVRALIAQAQSNNLPASGRDKNGQNFMLFNGPNAEYYNTHPRAQGTLGEAFKAAIRNNSYGRTL